MEHIAASQEDFHQAAQILREGGLISFPTETYYGLGVDPFNESALQRLFAIKNRPSVKPVLVLIPTRRHLKSLIDTAPAVADLLMDKFWPGPLTMVFPARKGLSEMLTGGTATIGIRISPHPVPEALLQVYGGPLTATSANRSGERAAVTDTEVKEIFGDDVDMILSGGRTPGHKPSTLVGFSDQTVDCIREGCIPCAEITEFLESLSRLLFQNNGTRYSISNAIIL